LTLSLDELRGAGGLGFVARRSPTRAVIAASCSKMLDRLAAGDVVTATRIDRLARSTFDLFVIVKRIVDAKAQFRSLAEPWADTGTSTGRLMLAVLGGLADVERDLIRTHTAEGRSRAQQRGQHMDRPAKLTEDDIEAAKAMLANHDIGMTQTFDPPTFCSGADFRHRLWV
jgi:DNA invertase Pin-like site-specific DNA recombinase